MRGCNGPRTAKKEPRYHVKLTTRIAIASGGRLSYTPSVERVVG